MTRSVQVRFATYVLVCLVFCFASRAGAAEISNIKYAQSDLDSNLTPDAFVIEAEHYTNKTIGTDTVPRQWTYVTSGMSNFRGTGYMQALPDIAVDAGTSNATNNAQGAIHNTTVSDVNSNPHLNYTLVVQTPGTYQLYLRFDDPLATVTYSDSLYMQLYDSSNALVLNGGTDPVNSFYHFNKTARQAAPSTIPAAISPPTRGRGLLRATILLAQHRRMRLVAPWLLPPGRLRRLGSTRCGQLIEKMAWRWMPWCSSFPAWRLPPAWAR